MPQITINTTEEERTKVLSAVKQLQGEVIPVNKLAEAAELPYSRARYALVDLIEAGKVRRIAAKAFNKHYCRYRYEVVE